MGKIIKFLFQYFFTCQLRKSQVRKSCFTSLPIDIITDIFVRLPIESVLICRCVCKHWNTLISDPNFAKLLFTYTPPTTMIRHLHSRIFHLVEYDRIKWHERKNNPLCCSVFEVLEPNSNSSIKLDPKFEIPLPDPKSIQGRKIYVDVLSCNGLFYLSCLMDRDISLVCNPITGEFIRPPKIAAILKPCKQISWGFGFHPKTNQYKVMRIHISKHDHHMVVEMHTVGTSTWINIEVDYPKHLIKLFDYSTYLNGALHWIGMDVDGNISIWAFNFDTERFQSFPMAPNDQYPNFALFEFRGSLCLIYCNELLAKTWMMERYGVGESWVPILTTSQLHGCLTYHDSENQEFRIFASPWYDPKVHGYNVEIISHVPTLIPLKDIIIGDNVEVQNIYSRHNLN
ncbi:hypothetical protein Ahy_A06g026990 [Arachis hypogaea]|uniref:F-box domain-containing protein n=1 Tax=Arachis hypogaea TaxID=3818 RepID=A0A445CMA7_ARAHY|nr:hypothetical protein Ahy_A06g026990 [Arachis hypogaea]